MTSLLSATVSLTPLRLGALAPTVYLALGAFSAFAQPTAEPATESAVAAPPASIMVAATDPEALRQQFLTLNTEAARGSRRAEAILETWSRLGVGRRELYINMAKLEKALVGVETPPAAQPSLPAPPEAEPIIVDDPPRLRTKLGLGYLRGYGGAPVDNAKAFALLKQASAEGYGEASRHLAGLYLRGLGTDKNVEKAHEMLMLAAEQGDADALISRAKYALREEHDPKGAIGYYVRAAELGEFDGYRNAALILRSTETSAEARRQAIVWLETALAKGDTASASELGAIYLEGDAGVPRDPLRAAHYFAITMESDDGRLHRQLREYLYPEDRAGAANRANLEAEKADKRQKLSDIEALRSHDPEVESFLVKLTDYRQRMQAAPASVESAIRPIHADLMTFRKMK